MAEIQNIGNPLELASELAKMEDAQVIGQIMVQQGAVHAVSFLLNNGCRRETARAMLESLRACAAVIRAEAIRRGMPDPFPQDQMDAPATPAGCTQPDARVGSETWRAMETAPKDGTLVRLLVEFEHHATEDGDGPHPTIGSNSWANHHDFDEWQFAGWSWEQDRYTQGVGKPVGWLPILVAGDVATDHTCELQALRKRIATYEARDALGLIPAPAHPDDAAVDRFAAAMKAKPASARAKGRSGWEDKAQCAQDSLALDLRRHVNKGDPVDVANFAMMLHQRGESTKLRPLSQDLVDAIKNAPVGASVIEHNGHPVFITRATEDGAPMLGFLESNHRELQAQVSSIKHLAGEIVLQMVGGSEVPQELESGMVVDLLYTPVQEGKQP